MICIGHRGARGHATENTLCSVRKALELGAEGIEVDVYFVDGELIVFHDARVERMTNGRGRLMRKTFAQLRALQVGKDERIPTLREVFDAVDRRAWINVELKGRNTATPVAELIREYVRERGWPIEGFLVSSFRRRELRVLAGGEIRLGVLFARRARRFAALAKLFGAYAIHPNLRFTNARLVRRAHALGLKVFVYTVNKPDDIARMKAMDVDGVFTDFPERVKMAES
jgi:glycerophosphoryl diester phosphodiesterase